MVCEMGNKDSRTAAPVGDTPEYDDLFGSEVDETNSPAMKNKSRFGTTRKAARASTLRERSGSLLKVR